MPPRNPSELARLEDEREYWLKKVKDLSLSRRSREVFLMNLRNVEARLGIKGENYNSEKF